MLIIKASASGRGEWIQMCSFIQHSFLSVFNDKKKFSILNGPDVHSFYIFFTQAVHLNHLHNISSFLPLSTQRKTFFGF